MGCLKLKTGNWRFVSAETAGRDSYDPIGNRGKSREPGTGLLKYTANNLNQYTLIASGGTSFAPAYDVFGNMTSCLLAGAPAAMKWNPNDRLSEIDLPNARIEFEYDSNGRRVAKKVYKNGTLAADRRFLYSGYKCVAEIDALANKVERFYSWTGESLLGIHNPQTKKSLAVLTDGNKNVVALLDEQGKITAQYAYSPYGGLAKSSGPAADENPFLFSSEYLDSETNLVYYNYRYYSPELGRWLSRDPKYIRGSVAWMRFSREDEIRELINKVNKILDVFYQLNVPDKYIRFTTDVKNYLEYKIILESNGVKSNFNPYSFVLNSPLDYWDYLGLGGLGLEGQRDAARRGGDTAEVIDQAKDTVKTANALERITNWIKNVIRGVLNKYLGTGKKKKKPCPVDEEEMRKKMLENMDIDVKTEY
jgi:RHS repeat-associated protein